MYVIGFLHVVHALMNARTAQGAIAWIISLASFPLLAIPLYWIAGHRRFAGYVRSRRVDNQKLREVSEDMHLRLRKHQLTVKNAFARARHAGFRG